MRNIDPEIRMEVVRTIQCLIQMALDVQRPAAHDAIVHQYGLDKLGFEYRSEAPRYSNDDERRQALVVARRRLGQALEAMLRTAAAEHPCDRRIELALEMLGASEGTDPNRAMELAAEIASLYPAPPLGARGARAPGATRSGQSR